jgi:hypothetical protein
MSDAPKGTSIIVRVIVPILVALIGVGGTYIASRPASSPHDGSRVLEKPVQQTLNPMHQTFTLRLGDFKELDVPPHVNHYIFPMPGECNGKVRIILSEFVRKSAGGSLATLASDYAAEIRLEGAGERGLLAGSKIVHLGDMKFVLPEGRPIFGNESSILLTRQLDSNKKRGYFQLWVDHINPHVREVTFRTESLEVEWAEKK